MKPQDAIVLIIGSIISYIAICGGAIWIKDLISPETEFGKFVVIALCSIYVVIFFAMFLIFIPVRYHELINQTFEDDDDVPLEF